MDSIVFATGFDAMTGALCNIEIRGRGGVTLKEKWGEGTRTYLGIMIAGFPNLFTITGPGSPSVLSNMAVSIEQHVDWIARCLADLREQEIGSIEATKSAEDDWVGHVNELGNATLFPRPTRGTWGRIFPGNRACLCRTSVGWGRIGRSATRLRRRGMRGSR